MRSGRSEDRTERGELGQAVSVGRDGLKADAYLVWWAVLGLWAAVNLITMVCSFVPVLPRRVEPVSRAVTPAAGPGRW